MPEHGLLTLNPHGQRRKQCQPSSLQPGQPLLAFPGLCTRSPEIAGNLQYLQYKSQHEAASILITIHPNPLWRVCPLCIYETSDVVPRQRALASRLRVARILKSTLKQTNPTTNPIQYHWLCVFQGFYVPFCCFSWQLSHMFGSAGKPRDQAVAGRSSKL